MKTSFVSLRSLLVAAAFVPVAASAQLAVTTQGLNMRAGPDASFPQVAYLRPGMRVNVVGCADGWQWCDVTAGPNRGWVYANYLSYSYNDRPTLVSYGGPMLGIPLVTFSIAPYWESYYRGRPFWNNRAQWYNHHVARALEWHAPPGWHGNDGRGHDNWHGNDGRAHDNNGRGNDNRANNDNRGNNDHRTSSYDPRLGPQYSANSGPDPRPHINDQNHPNVQQ